MWRILRFLILGRWRVEPTCTGDWFCFALRSPLCVDGRCREHCNTTGGCHCERLKLKRSDMEVIREITGIGKAE